MIQEQSQSSLIPQSYYFEYSNNLIFQLKP